ncbi:MAG TPA: hypothetical protein ENK11_00580 [Phycisphaerales bacterium]|nr:hypothetical protein [Phycisphaerales bacterium]
MIRNTALFVCLACVFVFSKAAPAGKSEPVDATSAQPDLGTLGAPNWTIRFEPVVYSSALSGDLRLASGGTRGDKIELGDLNLDSPRLSPKGRFVAARGPWRITIGGQSVTTSDRGTTVPFLGRIGEAPFRAGDRIVSDFSYQTFDVSASYLVFRRRNKESGPVEVDIRAELLAGLRLHRADISSVVVHATPRPAGTVTTTGADELFAEPIVGGRAEFEFARTFGIDVEITAGVFSAGDRSSFSFSIEPGFVYRPIPEVGLRIGYRFQYVDLSSGNGAGEFEWTGTIAGLYWGAQLTF